VGLVAALLARDLAGQATHWCLVPDTCRHPTTTAVASRIGLEPFLDLRLDLGEGAAALTALGVLQSALDLVSALPAAAQQSPAAEPSPGQPSPSEPEQR
jgi:NaMN:DMB phosphoribosyltransferase